MQGEKRGNNESHIGGVKTSGAMGKDDCRYFSLKGYQRW